MKSREWHEGYEAYTNGKSRWDNPYHVTLRAADDWYDGWLHGQKVWEE